MIIRNPKLFKVLLIMYAISATVLIITGLIFGGAP